MEFRLWLEGLEEYEPFRDKIEKYASGRKFPFNHMFTDADQNGRIYIPFQDAEFSKEEIEIVKELSSELEEAGYELVDIKQGYARQKGKSNNFKIGKLLEKLQYQRNKEIENEFASGQISKILRDRNISYSNKRYEELKTSFENLPSRIGGQFEIVISKNPHDLGSMSTGRGWESCMNLVKGSHRQDVYCEVAYGGFVAYLIKSQDKNIEKPLARIHIRRFDNKKGLSIAMPEETVYGNEVPGFLEEIQNWLVSKQGRIAAGPYSKQGGKYSDTFGNESKKVYFVPPEAEDKKKIVSWISKWMRLDKDKKAKYKDYFIQSIVSLFRSEGKYPSNFIKELKDFIFGDNYIPIKGQFSQHVKQFRSTFALRFPELINKDDFDSAVAESLNIKQILLDLLDKFPQFIDEEILSNVKNISSYAREEIQEKLTKEFPNLAPQMQAMVEDEINNSLRIDNPRLVVNSRTSVYEVRNFISNEMNKLRAFKPIPERLINKLINFVSNLDKLKLTNSAEEFDTTLRVRNEDDAKRAREGTLQSSIFVLSITETDTPSVQRFYNSLLPRWEEAGGVGVLGWAIARLGENGRQFLPFIIKKKEEIENINLKNPYDEKSRQTAIESFNHVIDTLQTGKQSKKYDMSHGEGFDTHKYKLRPEQNLALEN